MNILQVNDLDLSSRRFNGYDLNSQLRKEGICAYQAVMQKESADPYVVKIVRNGRLCRAALSRLETFTSKPGELAPWGRTMSKLPEFQQADLVHYHLIHNHILALPDFPLLTQKKPTVWTWHDPWAVTGHCVHPKTCQGWKTGCSPCPHLDEYFPLQRDVAGFHWEVKRQAYKQMDADIVVSSDFMMNFARNSPLGQCFSRVHQIPFGVHLEEFGQRTQQEVRACLGIPQDHFVLAFRNEPNPYKGICYIEEMLRREENHNVTILTSGTGELPYNLARRYHCIQLGWLDEVEMLADFYTACDVFLMPSVAESFGLMAVEAMASSRPVVCFEGTALPAVSYAPECGIAVPLGDVDSLGAAIRRLKEHPEERRCRGELGRTLSEKHYRFEDYVQRHLELYEDVIARRQK